MSNGVDFSADSWMDSRAQKRPASNWVKRTELQKRMYNQRKRERRAAKNGKEPGPARVRSKESTLGRDTLMHGYRIKSKYGVSLEWYDAQLLKQMGVCYICKSPPARKRLSIDHCHKTGSVRKLLCDNCNKALGFAKDSSPILNAMIEYLEEHDNS